MRVIELGELLVRTEQGLDQYPSRCPLARLWRQSEPAAEGVRRKGNADVRHTTSL